MKDSEKETDAPKLEFRRFSGPDLLTNLYNEYFLRMMFYDSMSLRNVGGSGEIERRIGCGQLGRNALPGRL